MGSTRWLNPGVVRLAGQHLWELSLPETIALLLCPYSG
jgi:hypothetical protein